MGHRPQQHHRGSGVLLRQPPASVARALDDKSEDARVALCALTLYDDAKVRGVH